VNEFLSTGVETDAQAKANEKAYHKALERIIEQAEIEIEQNWERVLQPVAQDFSDFVHTLQIDDACDEKCVRDVCFAPANWAMNWTCVWDICNCKLENPAATKQAKKDLANSVKNLTYNVIPAFKEEKVQQVAEAYRAYRIKQQEVFTKAAKEIKTDVI